MRSGAGADSRVNAVSGISGESCEDEACRFGEGERFRVLSDLHLGHDQSVIRKVEDLRPLIGGGGTVVFNGDTFEERAPCYREKSAAMLEELMALCREEGVRPVMVNGNHDPERWGRDAVDAAGGRMYVTHGHVLLRLVSPWSSKLRGCRGEIEAMLAAAGEWERLSLGERYALTRAVCLRMPPSETRQGSQSVAAKVGLLMREVWPPTRPWEVMKVWAGLPRLASEFTGRYRPGAKAVVFGHTHRAALWRRGGRWLVNTGGFVTFSRPWRVTWDGEGMVIERIRVKGGAFGVEGKRVMALG